MSIPSLTLDSGFVRSLRFLTANPGAFAPWRPVGQWTQSRGQKFVRLGRGIENCCRLEPGANRTDGEKGPRWVARILDNPSHASPVNKVAIRVTTACL